MIDKLSELSSESAYSIPIPSEEEQKLSLPKSPSHIGSIDEWQGV